MRDATSWFRFRASTAGRSSTHTSASSAAGGASDGCAGKPAIAYAAKNLKREAYADCKEGSEVVLWEILGGDHNWPGDIFPASGGGKTISASEAILAFFATHRRP